MDNYNYNYTNYHPALRYAVAYCLNKEEIIWLLDKLDNEYGDSSEYCDEEYLLRCLDHSNQKLSDFVDNAFDCDTIKDYKKEPFYIEMVSGRYDNIGYLDVADISRQYGFGLLILNWVVGNILVDAVRTATSGS